jgi:hypothetical protein
MMIQILQNGMICFLYTKLCLYQNKESDVNPDMGSKCLCQTTTTKEAELQVMNEGEGDLSRVRKRYDVERERGEYGMSSLLCFDQIKTR